MINEQELIKLLKKQKMAIRPDFNVLKSILNQIPDQEAAPKKIISYNNKGDKTGRASLIKNIIKNLSQNFNYMNWKVITPIVFVLIILSFWGYIGIDKEYIPEQLAEEKISLPEPKADADALISALIQEANAEELLILAEEQNALSGVELEIIDDFGQTYDENSL